jgi:hypothetical protein
MNAMNFSNVVLESDVEKYVNAQSIARDKICAHPLLESVISKLAVMYPLWRFEGSGHQSMTSQGSIWLTKFEVSCDGERLGEIARRYEGRDYQICVSNDRIRASMERSGFYKTKDANKAIAKVKKMFGPKDTQELAGMSREGAAKIAQNAAWSKERERSNADDIVKRAAHKYVMNAGFEAFMAYAKATLPMQEHELLIEKREVSDQAAEDLKTIVKVQEVLRQQENGAVVTRRGNTYVVEHKDKVEICDDNTLPEWVRSRIGMLKLIEPEQFVSGLGMRASTSTFVVIEPDPDPAYEHVTYVIEGETK